MAVLLCLGAAGCAGGSTYRLVGVWQTAIVEGDLGASVTTVEFRDDGTVVQQVDFLDKEQTVQGTGTYVRAGRDLTFHFGTNELGIVNRIRKLTPDVLVLSDDVWERTFRRK